MRRGVVHDEPVASESAEQNANSSFGRLARRLTGWTSNLVATSIILVIALVGGRELVSLWRADSNAEQTAPLSPAASWTAPHESYVLEYGDSPFKFQRDRVQGERSKALDQIQLRCREALEQRPAPNSIVGEAEEKLLDSIENAEPLEEEQGSWRIFLAPGPMPMLIGVRDDCAGSADDPDGISSRMVVWGMAIPDSEHAWSTYTCWTSPQLDPDGIDELSLSLPVGATRTLAISGDDGSRIIGFHMEESDASVSDVALQFERAATNQGWERSGQSVQTHSNWQAEFTRESPQATRMEIQLYEGKETDDTDRRAMRGLIAIRPKQ